MLLSYEHQFLFFHVPKTAGCSILDALTPLTTTRPSATWRRRLPWIGPINRIGGFHLAIEFPVHAAASTVHRCLPPRLYNQLYKFAFIRNPWDAMVSQYVYIRDIHHHHLHETVKRMSGFAEFIEWDLARHSRTQHRFVTDRHGRLLVDFLGRFESIEADFRAVCRHLNITVSLPHENKSNHRDYREYYNKHTRQLVARHFAHDIALFGYEFDPHRSQARARHYRLLPYPTWHHPSPSPNRTTDAIDTGPSTKTLKSDSSVTVTTNGRIVIKRYNRRNLIDPLKNVFRPSKAQRAREISSLLDAAAIPAAKVLSATDQTCCGLVTSSELITQYLDGHQALPDWTGNRRIAARHLAIVLAMLHNSGFSHRDLKPTNIMVDPDGHPTLIDFEGIQHVGFVPDHTAARNLSRLLRGPDAIAGLEPVHIRVFLRHYCRTRGISPRYLIRTAYPAATKRRRATRTFWITIGLVLAFVLGLGSWDIAKYRVFPKRWGAVQDGAIYRSGQLHAALVERTLRDHNIKVIVDLTAGRNSDSHQRAELDAAHRLGIEHHRYPLKGDGTGDIRQYAAAIARIHYAALSNQPVLVHCAAGSQRTGGVIASYRLFVEQARSPDVLREMERYDWDPVKDKVLLDYLNTHMETLARLLTEAGVIDAPPDPLPRLNH